MESYTDDENTAETTDLTTLNAPRKKKGTGWRNQLVGPLASCIPILFPVVHMYIFIVLWGDEKKPVDPFNCTCSCWDAIFKGSFGAGVKRFKHVYFNSDTNTLKMWILTVTGVILLYEAFKRLFFLLLSRKLRWTMAILFLSSLYSHYYAWWGHWNYWNDDIYHLWNHQVFFTASELISTVMVLKYLDLQRPIQPLQMLMVCSIAVFHALCSGSEEFFHNVFDGYWKLRQILRDIGLMMTDIVHTTIPIYELWLYARRSGTPLRTILFHRDHLYAIASVFIAMFVIIMIFP